ncbi:MAG: TPM domain-containing protein [Hydrogenoanaerobacterium sp.]
MKLFRCIVAVAVCLLLCTTFAFAALPEHTGQYSNDFANVLSDETKEYINNNGAALEKATKAQITVATVTSLDGQSVEEYALELGRKWGVGGKTQDNGLMILLAPTERKITVQVGYGLEGALNDSKIGRFLDNYAVPYLKNDDWTGGVHNLYSALLAEVYKEYNMEVPQNVEAPSGENAEDDYESIIGAVIAFAVIALIIFYIIKHKNGGGGNGGGGDDDDDINGGGYVGPFIGGYGAGYLGGRRRGGGDFGGGGFGGGGGGGFGGGGGSFGGGGGSRGF